jgi:hypothetical protein
VTDVRRCVEIAAPPAAVWDVLADVRTLPQVSASTVEVDGPARLDRRGQAFEQTVAVAGRRFRSRWEVVDIDPGRSLAIEGSVLPGTHYRMEEAVEALDPARSRLCLTMRYRLPFGPLGRLAGKLGVERRAVEEAEAVLAGVAQLAQARAS